MTFRRTRCGHCKAHFQPERQSQIVHMECVEAYVEAQAEKRARVEAKAALMAAKVERAEDRKKRDAMKTIAQLIAAAQDAFNSYVRERDRDKGCFVCNRPFLAGVIGRQLHAGHVRTRGAAGHLRFNEDNCMGECEGCNGPRGAKPHQIKAGAIARIGVERFEALENNNTPHKWGRDELLSIKTKYRALANQLKKEREA